jgi:hypothetical protein
MGILRAIVPGAVAYAVGKGWVPAGSAADIGAALIAIGAAAWSFISNIEAPKGLPHDPHP